MAKCRLTLQVINACKLSYKWQSFDTALANIVFMGTTPEDSRESIREAAEMAKQHNWSASALRKSFR